MSPWLTWGLIWILASVLTGIAWALAGIGTPDDHEIGSDRWPRIDCPDEVEP
jgi:hypothetical protein